MTLALPTARRLTWLGCALAATLGLTLTACGSDGAASAKSTAATTQPKSKASPEAAASRPCPARLDTFVDSLDRLRQQLAVGLSYEQYATRIKALQTAYGQVPIDRLAIDCLTTTGIPAEQAFNKYIGAANAWGECLADASCTTASIEPVLQRKWRLASGLLPN